MEKRTNEGRKEPMPTPDSSGYGGGLCVVVYIGTCRDVAGNVFPSVTVNPYIPHKTTIAADSGDTRTFEKSPFRTNKKIPSLC